MLTKFNISFFIINYIYFILFKYDDNMIIYNYIYVKVFFTVSFKNK